MSIGLWQILLVIGIVAIGAIPIAIAIRIDKKEGKTYSRRSLALTVILFLVVVYGLDYGISDTFLDEDSMAFFQLFRILIGLGIYCILARLVSSRLRAAGKSPYLTFLLLLPIINLILVIYCLLIKRNSVDKDDSDATEHSQSFNRAQILGDYGEYLEANPLEIEIRDVNCLPHSKQTILQAIFEQLRLEKNQELRPALEIGATLLPYFQEGVGPKPVSQLGMNHSELVEAMEPDKDITDLISTLANSDSADRFKELMPKVEKEKAAIEKLLLQVS